MARALLIIETLEAENRRIERRHTARLRRSLRDQAKALELSDAEFRAHYRLSKEVFIELCSELAPYMSRSQRRTKVSVECKVGTYLLNNETVHNIFNIYMTVAILGPNSTIFLCDRLIPILQRNLTFALLL